MLEYQKSRDKSSEKKKPTLNDYSTEESVPSNQEIFTKAARINPTFLSYGSHFLSKNNNYLASYGKSILS